MRKEASLEPGERMKGDRRSLCGIVDLIRDVSDMEYQKRIWGEQEGPEVSTFLETVCGIYDDYRLTVMTGGLAQSLGMSEVEVAALRDFESNFTQFVDSLSDEEVYEDSSIIQNPKWPAVVETA